jgi:hypothetical protein
VNGLGDCESIHGEEERNSGPREPTKTWDRASEAAAEEAKGAAAGGTAARKGAKMVS